MFFAIDSRNFPKKHSLTFGKAFWKDFGHIFCSLRHLLCKQKEKTEWFILDCPAGNGSRLKLHSVRFMNKRRGNRE